MLKLHVIQAGFGDCLLLEWGSGRKRKFMLVDGGPAQIYERHLRGILAALRARTALLDFAVLSHVDDDHVTGLLDYFADLRQGPADLPGVRVLWHNSFAQTVDRDGGVEARLRSAGVQSRMKVMANSGMALLGIEDGHRLRAAANALGIPLNAGFADGLILIDTVPGPLDLGGATLTVTGPSRKNLDRLRREWLEWLDAHEDAIRNDDVLVMANADSSTPNLSSITFLFEADGRKILFTGDGRSDHLLDGLRAVGKLTSEGTLHVDVLKLMHHGSDRNVTQRFFRTVTADTYVVSANGRDGNPDLAAMIWLVEAAREQNRRVTIVATNRTPSLDKLVAEYKPADYGYKLRIMAPTAHSLTLKLS